MCLVKKKNGAATRHVNGLVNQISGDMESARVVSFGERLSR